MPLKPDYQYIDIFRYWKRRRNPKRESKSGYEVFGGENWVVQNTTTWKTVPCTSEAACKKIIALALAELNDEKQPLNHVHLERKAGQLLGW